MSGATFKFKVRFFFSSCADIQQSYRQESITPEAERPASPLTGALIYKNARQQPQLHYVSSIRSIHLHE